MEQKRRLHAVAHWEELIHIFSFFLFHTYRWFSRYVIAATSIEIGLQTTYRSFTDNSDTLRMQDCRRMRFRCFQSGFRLFWKFTFSLLLHVDTNSSPKWGKWIALANFSCEVKLKSGREVRFDEHTTNLCYKLTFLFCQGMQKCKQNALVQVLDCLITWSRVAIYVAVINVLEVCDGNK